MVEFRADEKTAEKLTEIATTLDISRSDLLLSMVKFALTNHQWARFGLTHKTLPRYEENPMATKKFSPAQIAAQKLFAERARAGTLGKTVKRKRIAAGSGEKMRKPGQVGRPTAKAFEQSAMTAKRNPEKVMHQYTVFHRGTSNIAGTVRETSPKAAKEKIANRLGIPTLAYLVARKTNPDKTKPRAYVKRVSQATGAPPSKRLITRRKKALTAPAGYFPNPKVKYTNRAKDLQGDQRVGYAVHMADRPSYQAIAWFTKKDDAVQVAQEASDRTGKQLAVTRVQNYFGAM